MSHNIKKNILLVDDHKIIRDGLISLLSNNSDFKIVGEAENGLEAMEILKVKNVDIIIMDISMGTMNGIECTKKVKSDYPNINILILSMYKEPEYIREAFKAGAEGYILKNSGKKELLLALQTISQGKLYFSSEITQTYLESVINHNENTSQETPVIDILTDREIEIIKLIANEYSNKEIADNLCISVRTVDAHKRNILNKLDVKNTVGIAKFYIENKSLF